MKKTKIFFVIAWLLLLAVVLLSAQPPVYAIESGNIGVMPVKTKDYPNQRSWFVYEAEAKTEIKDQVELSNSSSKTVTLMVTALDGAVSGGGGYTLVGGTSANKDIGTWVKLEANEVTLPPKSKRTLNFTVTVPDNADVGSHAGGIVIQEKPADTSATKKKGSQLTVVTRVAARMYLTVPGDIQRGLEVKQIRHSISNGLLYFFLHLKNNGNVQLNPVVDVTLRGLFGRVGSQNGSQIGMLLRGTEITAQLPWQKNPPAFGRFVADFRLHYGEKDFKGEYVKDEYVDARYVFWIIQWVKLLWFIGGIILLLLIRNLWLWLLIQSRLNTRTKKHKVKKGETLLMVAGMYGVHPKKLAKFNLLRWPYELNVGDVLLIPQGQMSRRERQTMGDEWNAYYRAEQRKVWLTDLKFVGGWLGKLRFRRRGGGVVSTARHSGKVRFVGPHPESYDPGQPTTPRLRRSRARMTKSKIPASAPTFAGLAGMTQVSVPTVATETLVAEQGDTIYDIADFAGVSIQEIVQLNHLRPPYRLKPGQEVLVLIKKPVLRKTKKSATPVKPKSTKSKKPRRKR